MSDSDFKIQFFLNKQIYLSDLIRILQEKQDAKIFKAEIHHRTRA